MFLLLRIVSTETLRPSSTSLLNPPSKSPGYNRLAIGKVYYYNYILRVRTITIKQYEEIMFSFCWLGGRTLRRPGFIRAPFDEKETATVDSITIAPRPTTHNKLQYSKSFELHSDSLLVGIAPGNVLATTLSSFLMILQYQQSYHTPPTPCPPL